ncbi:histamine H2 receptor-like [Mercenaria mercenaria]|uniref:histamine H2 receptor-like n=1 Tax=Mercenaria mercenaria TaxID=6596 RepID=UPI00234EE5D3|nr:histamine H2 receptor-like [Mercenaria mercenaria]
MHVQTEFPVSEFEMYIKENASGNLRENITFTKHENGSYHYMDTDYRTNLDMNRPDVPQTARGVSLVIFVAIGFAFNTFMIVSIVPNRRLRTVRNILLVHLGCTGLLLSFLINLSTAVVSFTGKWFGGVVVCQLYGFLLTVLTFVTSWTITALSWDKYQTIASPLHHSLTATALKMIVCFTVFWTLACTLSIPPLLGGSRYVFHADKGICFFCTKSVTGKVYIVSFLLAAIYIPLGVMLFCYTHIYRIARTQSSRIAATMVQMTCVIQATIAPNSPPSSLSIKGTKAMCTIFQLIGSFVVVYIPLSVILLAEVFTSDDFRMNSVLSSTFIMLYLSAPVVHSSVYGLRNKILRNSFQRYLRRKIRYYCYKDKRKNSIKSFRSFRSSSFKAAMMNRRNQNGDAPGLRRTQSFPVRGYRAGSRHLRVSYTKQNGCLAVPEDPIVRPRSYNALNPETNKEDQSADDKEPGDIHFEISDIDEEGDQANN